MGFVVFFTLFSAVLFGMHYLVYIRIVQTIPLAPNPATLLKYFFIFAGISFIAGGFFFRFFQSHLLFYFGSVWFGIIAIAFAVFAARELFAFFFINSKKELTIISLGIAFFISAYSLWNASGPPILKELDIALKGLKKEFKAVLISDLQLTRYSSIERLKSIADIVNGQNPDVIFLTGDLIDDNVEGLRLHIEELSKLKSRLGLYAVTGNHEYYSGVENFFEIAERLNWKVLSNETTEVDGIFNLIGIDDREARTYSDYDAVLKPLTEKSRKETPTILLAHRPEPFDEAISLGVDAMFAGHTHAGQIPPMDLLIRLFVKYSYGFYRVGSSALYTTCGTSTWGPPMRFTSKSEVVSISFSPLKEATPTDVSQAVR